MVFFSLKLQLQYGLSTEGSAVLYLPHGARPQALWLHLRGVCHPLIVEVWRLSDAGDTVPRFAPGQRIFVRRVTAIMSASIGGDPSPGGGHDRARRFHLVPPPPPDRDRDSGGPDGPEVVRLSGCGGPDDGALADGCPDDGIEGHEGVRLLGGGAPGGDEDGAPGGLERGGDDPGDGGPPHEDGDEVGGRLGQRMRLLDRELAEIDDRELWSAEEDSADEGALDDGGFGPAPEPPAPEPLHIEPVAGDAPIDRGFGPAPDPAPVPPEAGAHPDRPAPPPPDIAESPRRARRHDRGAHHDGPWNKVETAAWGKFVLDETGTNASIGCHCPYHGCRINKKAWKRPIGWMTAWVLAGRPGPEPERLPLGRAGKERHMEMRLEVEPGQPLDEVERASARIAALADDQMSRVFQWERDAGREEVPDDREPEVIDFQ